ncbi:MAG: ATP-binding protein [Candidatus Rokuibacteriota bacterium]
MSRAGATLAIVTAQKAEDRPRAVRRPDGLYPRSEYGKLAITGDVLDDVAAGVVVANAWRLRECPWCWRPDVIGLVPAWMRRCAHHGLLPPLPAVDPYPFSDEERRVAERRAWAELGPRLGVPSRYLNFRLEDAEPTLAIRTVASFLSSKDDEHRCDAGCLVLAGPTGVGKTVALVCALRRVAVWCAGSCVYYSFPSLVRRLIGADDGEDAESAFEKCIDASHLFVDDAYAGYLKPDGLGEALWDEILTTREARDLITIVTTNFTRPRFEELAGDRVADRLAGPWGLWADLPGASRRRSAPQRAVRARP